MQLPIPSDAGLAILNTDELIGMAVSMWNDCPPSACYRFGLGFINGEWCLHVTDSWTIWLAKGLKHEFRNTSPRAATVEFLGYVRDNNLNIAELAGR